MSAMETSRDAMRTRTHELVGWAQHQTGGRRPWNVRAALSSCSSGSDRGTTKACGKLKGSNINTNNNSTTTSTSVLALKIGSSGGVAPVAQLEAIVGVADAPVFAGPAALDLVVPVAGRGERPHARHGRRGWESVEDKKKREKKGMSRKKNNQIVHPRTGIRR